MRLKRAIWTHTIGRLSDKRECGSSRVALFCLAKIMWRVKITIISIFLLTTAVVVFASPSADVTFFGTTDPGAVVFIRVDDTPGVTTIADKEGHFKKTIENLDEGGHAVLLYATDNKGRRSDEFIMPFNVVGRVTNITISDIKLNFPPLPEPECKGTPDLNHDDKVNLVDFAILLWNWGIPKNCEADQNQDGIVNFTDFSILISKWTK